MSSPDLVALSWCLAEIRESLSRAEAALEQQLSAPDDDALLRQARVHLHQAHGALQVVDLDGVSVVTQEAEGLLDRIERGDLRLDAELVNRLSRSFGAILEYLEDLLAGAAHQPVMLFPYYRTLLEARAAERIEPADLYFPDLTIRPPRTTDGGPPNPQHVVAARLEFERALLGFLRQPGERAPVAAMRAATEKLYRAHSAGSNRIFWWLALALFDALAHEVLPVDLYVKRLVARLNLQIRRTLDQRAPIAERTLKDLLFHLARARAGAPLADEARALYRLEATVPADFETPRFGRIDARALRAGKDSCAQAKSAWERIVRGDADQSGTYAGAVQALGVAVARLPWPGAQALVAALERAHGAGDATGAAPAGAPDEALALEVATALLFTEQALERGAQADAALDARAAEMAARLGRRLAAPQSAPEPMPTWLTELSRAAQERLTLAAVVAELTQNLKTCESALDAFFREPSQRGGLRELRALLRQVAGALRVLGHEDAARAAIALSVRVAAFAASEGDPGNERCEAVARSLGALGFFVDSLQHPDRRSGEFRFDESSGELVATLGLRQPAPVAPAQELNLDGWDIEGQAALAADAPATASAPHASPDAGARDAPATADETGAAVAGEADAADAGPADAAGPAETAPGAGEPFAGAVPAGGADTAHETVESRLAEHRRRLAEFAAGALAAAPSADERFEPALREMLEAVLDDAQLLDDGELKLAAREALAFVADARSSDVAGLERVLAPLGVALPARAELEATAPPPSAEAIDAELLEIFLTEADEVLAAIESELSAARAAGGNIDRLTTIRRCFHTLKGSSRMVGLAEFGEAAWALEQVMNQWLAEERAANEELYALIGQAQRVFVCWVAALRDGGGAPDAAELLSRAHALRDCASPPAPPDLLVDLLAGSAYAHEVDALLGLPEPERHSEADADDGEALDPLAEAPPEPAAETPPEPAADEPPEAAETAHEREDEAPQELARATTVEDAPTDRASGTASDDELLIGGRRIGAKLFRIFLAEADELVAAVDAAAADWRRDPSLPAPEPAQRAMHSLAGSSLIVGLGEVREAAERLESFMLAQARSGRALEPQDLDALEFVVERVRAMLHQFAAGRAPAPEPRALADAGALAERWAALMLSAPDAMQPTAAAGADLVPTADAEQGPTVPLGALAVPSAEAAGADELVLRDEIDPDLGPVFVEEADDLMPKIGDLLREWARQPADHTLPAALMRLLHTTKGSARMAGAMRLGQLVHEMETRVEAALALPRVPVALIEELIARHDQVLARFDALREPAARGETGGADDAPNAAAGDDALVAAADSATTAGSAAAPQMIRVRSDLLDKLVNEAGEVSIARARLENELSVIRQSLGELNENVARLRSQLREIEIQADTQIEARAARNKQSDVRFDPLEFDRYTRFQELTRMLAESVSDVSTVQQNAMRSVDEAWHDLTRQGQVTRDLQQDLMRVRMVQFSTLADRLYRVVRQAAKELDKRVNLDLKGAAVEIDRGVLERMAGPIEHLLRNAVVHGIESRSERSARGKAETGDITLEVRLEGNEVILGIVDDGEGLNYERIRARAVERGLLDAGATPADHELAQLIFMPGFTTATEVTALAGRGIGMDAVRSEVAAMGGRIDIDSRRGTGTRFTVHLPVSLAVAQVVLLGVSQSRFAVPSALVEQVIQFKPEQLAAAYETHDVEWQGQQVPLYFLGSLLELQDCAPVAQRYSPVVVLRSGHQRIALHVDHVAPNQEVVVKHVGPQLARLVGIAGATVLGNGEIVLIVNPVQIAATRGAQQAGEGDTASFAPTQIPVQPTVLVVDDSVTVRKFTQRLLSREGYQVVLAKDGVDALRQLQDLTPDAMLVDIEMPRMDGFDLTRNIRSDARLHALPIVMITSRTADKHRNHALSLGVDVFLGKPYAEAELLSHLQTLIGQRRAIA